MRKKHTYEDRLKYMKLLEDGYSVKHIATHYGISHHLLSVLWEKYQQDGPAGLIKKQNIRSDGSYREMVLRDIENNCLTLSEAAIKYNVSVDRIMFWRRMARESGYDALYETKRRGRPPKDMGRPRKKKPEEMTELAELCASFGMKAAYNFDGGGSTAMYWNNTVFGHNDRVTGDILAIVD